MNSAKKHNTNKIIAILIIIANFIFKNNEYVLESSALIVTVIVIIAVLPVSKLRTGIYPVSIAGNGKMESKKIIVQ